MKTPTAVLILVFFLITGIVGPMPASAQNFVLPAPGVMVPLSPPIDPPILKGIKVHPDDPFRFDFILDQGDEYNRHPEQEATKLIKYFLASLTIPEKDLWVNLSPYEKDRIIPRSFGLTEMGRDLLGEDYMLKQITASLIYPEGEVGKKFWKRIYEESEKKFGTTNIPVNTFNKVWIVPEKAVVYENPKTGTAYVVESKLKVMLDQDYLSLSKHYGSPSASLNSSQLIGANIVREIVIPELTKEVNEDKNFSKLRQVYNSLMLATWYKKKIKDSILAQVYDDKKKIAGVGYKNSTNIEAIYQRYIQAFKKGVYNYIKEEQDPINQEIIPRKYFSGGFNLNMAMLTTTTDGAMMGSVLRSLGRKTVFLLGVSLALFNSTQAPAQTIDHFEMSGRPSSPTQVREQTVKGFQIYGNQYSLSFAGSNPNEGTIMSAQGQAEGNFNFFIFPNGESVLRTSQDLTNFGITGKSHFFLVNPGRDQVSYIASTDNPSISSGEVYLNQGLWALVGQYLATGSLSAQDQTDLQQQFTSLFGNAASSQVFLFTDNGNVEFGANPGQPNYSPFVFSKGTVIVSSPRFAPPAGKTIWLIGQQVDMIDKYVAYFGKVPGGLMTYTSIDKMEGLNSPADEGGGEQYAQYLVDKYPNTALQMGLYMVNQLDKVISGGWDANIETLANWIKQTKRPVYLRIGYEFDNPANGYDPVKYKAAYQYIVNKFRALGVTNVSFVWHSAAAPGQTVEAARAWYPGPGYVDFVGVSRFNSGQDVLGAQFAQFARENNLAFTIAETSPMGLTTSQDRANFYSSLFNFIQANNVGLVGDINCDWDTLPLFQNNGWGDQEIQNDGTDVIQQYTTDVLQNNAYLQSEWNLFLVLKFALDRAMLATVDRLSQTLLVQPHEFSFGIGKGKMLHLLSPHELSLILADPKKFYVMNREGSRLEPVIKEWETTETTWERLNARFALLSKARQVYRNQKDKSKPVVILSWGAGTAAGEMGLDEALSAEGIPHVIYCLSQDYFPQWRNADKNIIFILDDATNLPRYLKPGSVDIMFSYLGLNHFLGRTSFRKHSGDIKEHIDDLWAILKPGGALRMNNYQSIDTSSNDGVLKLVSKKEYYVEFRKDKAQLSKTLVIPGSFNLAVAEVKSKQNFQRLARVLGFTGLGADLERNKVQELSVQGHDLRTAELAKSVAGRLGLNDGRASFIALVHDYGAIPFRHLGQSSEVRTLLSSVGFDPKENILRLLDEDGFQITDDLKKDILNFDINKTQFLSQAGKVAISVESVEGVFEDIFYGIRYGIIKPQDIPAGLRDLLHLQNLADSEIAERAKNDFDGFVVERSEEVLRSITEVDVLTARARQIKEEARKGIINDKIHKLDEMEETRTHIGEGIMVVLKKYMEQYGKSGERTAVLKAIDHLAHMTDDEVIEESNIDRAQMGKVDNLGGIDLTPANMHLQTQNAGEGITFHLDPALLKQLQNAPGLVPVIINIQPMKNIEVFLGLAEGKDISNHS